MPPARFSGCLGRQEAAISPGLPGSAACRLQTFRLPTSTRRGKGQGSELPHGHAWDRSVRLPAAPGTGRGWGRLRHAPRQRAQGLRGLPGPAAASGSEPGWATARRSPVPLCRGVAEGTRRRGPCAHAAAAPRQRRRQERPGDGRGEPKHRPGTPPGKQGSPRGPLTPRPERPRVPSPRHEHCQLPDLAPLELPRLWGEVCRVLFVSVPALRGLGPSPLCPDTSGGWLRPRPDPRCSGTWLGEQLHPPPRAPPAPPRPRQPHRRPRAPPEPLGSGGGSFLSRRQCCCVTHMRFPAMLCNGKMAEEKKGARERRAEPRCCSAGRGRDGGDWRRVRAALPTGLPGIPPSLRRRNPRDRGRAARGRAQRGREPLPRAAQAQPPRRLSFVCSVAGLGSRRPLWTERRFGM